MKHSFLPMIFSIAVLTEPTHAYNNEIPVDLTKWLVMGAPDQHDESYWDDYEDDKHRWVVFLQNDRPTVRLWKSFREKDSYYSSMQESYPPIPFQVEQDFKLEGHSGAWLSTKVSDGWIIGFNKGEWGGGLWFYSPDGKRQSKISDDQIVRFIQIESGLLALVGCEHGNASNGKIMRLSKEEHGVWHSELIVDLKDTPAVATSDKEGFLIVVTYARLLRINLKTKEVETLVGKAFWGGLQPTSIILSPSGSIFIGMRHGVVEIEKLGAVYHPKWLVPDAEYEAAAKKVRANRPPGFR